ncbi:MAG: hypothetical protein AAGA30_00165 [Planctomycetota bacterium]
MYSISAVHRLTGKARSTIAKHIKEGVLSCTVEEGRKLIEASELVRVYDKFLELDENGRLKPKTRKTSDKSSSDRTSGQYFEKLLEMQQRERDRERRQLEETIVHLRDDLEKSQQRESRATLLLESQSKDSDLWKKQLSEIEKRIANQERDIEKYRKALQRERSKTIWQKLLG